MADYTSAEQGLELLTHALRTMSIKSADREYSLYEIHAMSLDAIAAAVRHHRALAIRELETRPLRMVVRPSQQMEAQHEEDPADSDRGTRPGPADKA